MYGNVTAMLRSDGTLNLPSSVAFPVTLPKPRSVNTESKPLLLKLKFENKVPPWQWKQSAPRTGLLGLDSPLNSCNPRCSAAVNISVPRMTRSNLLFPVTKVSMNCSRASPRVSGEAFLVPKAARKAS